MNVLNVSWGSGHQGTVTDGQDAFPASFGRAGVTEDKREGDHATPLGSFRLRSCYWRADRVDRPRTGLPTIPITQDLGWCDDPGHALYNRPVRLPFPARHERMARDDRAYDLVVVLDQNMAPARAGAGSAVFWHLTKQDGVLDPTEGCVAVTPDAMRRLLVPCDARTILRIERAS